MLEKDKEKKKNKSQKKAQNVVFGVGGGKEGALLKLTCFRKVGKHDLVSEGGKKGHLR